MMPGNQGVLGKKGKTCWKCTGDVRERYVCILKMEVEINKMYLYVVVYLVMQCICAVYMVYSRCIRCA